MNEAGRDANAGPAPGKNGRRRGEQAMVPDAEFASYYGRPVLKEPVWRAPDVAGYLFLGGLAGASSVLAAGAQLARCPDLAGRAKMGAAGAIGLSATALVRDLGRPARFFNMLRVFKPSDAGRVSARDPQYTIVPQRERLHQATQT